MRVPVEINKAEVFIDSAHGPQGRTVLVLRFAGADIHIDISTATASRIRKLNRVATGRDEAAAAKRQAR